jgi:hypothetical protein
MSLPRISVGMLMIVVAVISLNAAAIRWMDAVRSISSENAIGVLSMGGTLMILLPVMLLRLARTGESGSFLLGFEEFGWAAVLAYLACLVFSHGWITAYAEATLLPLWYHVLGPSRTIELSAASGARMVFISSDDRLSVTLWGLSNVFVFTAPQLLIASLGGWSFRRLGVKVVVESRSRSNAERARSSATPQFGGGDGGLPCAGPPYETEEPRV